MFLPSWILSVGSPNSRARQEPPPPSSVFQTLPRDLLIEIASLLECRQDVLNFCITSRHVFTHVSAVLYAQVTLKSVEQCNVTLDMLRTRPGISRHVRELVIRPQARLRKTSFNTLDNAEACSAVAKVAASKSLDALVRFQWDDDELPYHDEMWFALRMGCPQLRYIAASIGSLLPSINNHLYDFTDLKGFSVTLKSGFYECHPDVFIEEDHPITKKLWDMLTRRCPNLEELTIQGSYSVPTDIRCISEGRWPNLRKLTLGDVCIDWFPRSLLPGEKRPFIAFLEAHPRLESLSLSRHTVQPIHLASLDPPSLGRVTSFSGTHQQLLALPQIHSAVRRLAFCDSVETREVSATTVANLLRELTKLAELRISFTLHSMYDSGNLLRSLIQSCPRLRHLELTCAHKPSFQLDAFAKTIRGFPKLRSLALTIVRYPGDETLSAGAAFIARSNPRLRRFSLTFIPPVYPVSLPFSLSFLARPLNLLLPLPDRASGSFELRCDEHGLPLNIAGREHSKMVWPWGLGTSCKTRRYVRDLRPPGLASVRRGGVRGFVDLVCERSSAGEEVRMILFCAMLVCFAVWGFVVTGRSRVAQRAVGGGGREVAMVGVPWGL
ncbi:hypothetical protein DFP72DRAFT_1000569 [Ephemerocybe angulata]|uniref:F-box domain-containing protein n=1 Tax=Ephemerocybe angulata TaxID=980116 RepID=A0A8H6ICX6_9AGAR|nr:hypothetical protein DFP72DRAFT_1000569 [Tulosesus angulatus]